MKKYITVAALLAAGTAFASADVVVKDSTQSTDSYDAETGLLTGEGLFDQEQYHAASTTIKLDLTNLGFVGVDGGYSGEDTILVEYRIGEASTTSAIGLAATTDGIKLTWQGSVWSNLSSHYISWDALKADSFTEGESTYVVLTLESTRALNASGGGTFVYNSEGDAHVSGADTAANFGASGLRSTADYSSIYLNSDYVAAAYVTPGVATKEQIVAAGNVIPEPSAFGMLAGLGALALVASRRRRK